MPPSISKTLIYRSGVGLEKHDGLPSERSCLYLTELSSSSSGVSKFYSVTDPVALRLNGSRHPCGSSCQAIHAPAAAVITRFQSSKTSSITTSAPSVSGSTLLWWTQLSNLLVGVPFQLSPPTMTLTTDASLRGWGAHLDGSCVRGQWPLHLRSKHMNYLELLVILWALQRFTPQLKGHTVRVLLDNMTAVYYLNKQGGTASRSLCNLALTLQHGGTIAFLCISTR